MRGTAKRAADRDAEAGRVSVRANRWKARRPWQDRQTLSGLRAHRARGSLSPSCSWLSRFRETDERKPKCSIFTALNSTGAGASSPSRPARSPARPTAPCSPPTARPPCSPPSSPPRSRSEGVDFFPLTVNYQEKYYAAGRIPGGYFKREGRPTEKETLVSRLIDRPIRPLFADGFRNETQVIVTVLSHDLENDPDILAHGRRLRRADPLGRALHGPDRRRPRRLHRRRIRAQPARSTRWPRAELDLVVAGTAGRRADGRVGGQGAVRGRSCSAP